MKTVLKRTAKIVTTSIEFCSKNFCKSSNIENLKLLIL